MCTLLEMQHHVDDTTEGREGEKGQTETNSISNKDGKKGGYPNRFRQHTI
jgi:hypothetical protein